MLLNSDAYEILTSGNKGGGKTLAATSKIYMDCMRHKRIKWAFFRKTLPEARETFLRYARANFPYGTYKEKVAQNKIVFPTGSECVLGHIENDKDLTKYQGLSFHRVCFDEATVFTDHQIGYIKAQVRSDNKDVPAQIIYCTNPGGISHGWFKSRFIDNKEDFEKYETPESKKIRQLKGWPEDRAKYLQHIKMMLEDNTFLMESDPDYITRLHELSDKDKPALLYGSWEVLSGKFFNFGKEHIIPFYDPSVNDNLFISIDWGTDKPFAIHWYAIQPNDRIICYRELYGRKEGGLSDEGCNMTAEEVAVKILDHTPIHETIRYAVCDTACWSQDGHGVSIYELLQNVLKSRSIFLMKAQKDRINGWESVKRYLQHDIDGKPFLLISQECPEMINQLTYSVYDEKKNGDIDTRSIDHAADGLRYMCMSRPMPKSLLAASKNPPFSLNWWKQQNNKEY